MKDKKEVTYRTTNFICSLAQALKPTEPMTVSEWAGRYMELPKGDANAGKYSVDYAPYQKAIMDAITDPEVVDVSVMSSSQIGKSLIMKCGIGYYIDHEPTTQLVVLPTVELGERFSRTSLAPMINDVKRIYDKVAKSKTRDSSNTIMAKSYPGGDLIIAGANSPSSLAQLPRRIVWMDEIDRFPESAGGEGNPILLAEKRTTSYWNKKHIKTSTPTIRGYSKIEEEFENGSQEVWSAACPECGEFQEYDFQRINFKSVSMACKYCGCLSTEKQWKKSKHKWIASHPERKSRRSFHINELATPMGDWVEIIERWKKADRRLKKFFDPHDMKVFINTTLGQTWDDSMIDREAVDDEKLKERAEYYGAEIPEGVLFITAAVDVQDNRFEVEIRGWARKYETWGLYKTEIYGELEKTEVWEELEAYLSQTLSFADGRKLGIAGFAIDTGGSHTNRVYKWAKEMKEKGKKCYAIKGYAGKEDIRLVHKRSVVNIKEERNGQQVVVDRTIIYILGVNSGKDDITRRLKIREPGEGYCHFPDEIARGYDSEYYKGLTSESKIIKQVRGKRVTEWKKKSGARNEPFDLLNYNYAVLEIMRPEWDKLEDKIRKGINYIEKKKKKPIARKNQKGIEL